MKEGMLFIVDKFRGKRVAVFGDVMLDIFSYGITNRISPEAPVPVVEIDTDEELPGGAANTANNVLALGGIPLLVGVIGEDDNAKLFRRILAEAGISDVYLIVDKGRPTTTKSRILVQKQQIVRVDRESSRNIGIDIEDMALEMADRVIRNADFVILSDYNKGFFTDRVCKGLIRFCNKYGKVVIVDPKAEFSKYRGANILTPNKKELLKYSGVTAGYTDAEILNIIKENCFDAIVVTKGDQGMTLYDKEGGYADFPAINSGYDVFDVTGAGDTVISVIGLAISSGAKIQHAAQLSNYAAGLVVRKIGTATITADELKKELERLVK